MAYPGSFQSDLNPRRDQVPVVTESIPPGEAIRNPMVHMDLDPHKTLVGDFDRQDYPLVPVLKVADLGLSGRPRNDTCGGTRRRGQEQLFFLPEQVSEEWDYVKGGLGELRGQRGGWRGMGPRRMCSTSAW